MLANAADEEARARAHEDAAGFAKLGLPDDEITTWVDVHAWTDQKFDSLAAHASQSDNVYFLQLGREKFGQQLGVETFLRVDAGVTPGLREDDLFAGRSG
jgi:LmbE family N-acetylglucosaminyl deacetylase